MAHGSSNPVAQVEFSRPAAGAITSVAASATTVTVLASNTNRKSASFYNDSTSNAFLKLGDTASSTSFTVKIPADGLYELPQPCYTGVVDCIWEAAVGNMRVTEIT